MNLDFQDPFGSAKPKTIERKIDDLFCRCAVFSRNGRFLAAGCSDNSIIILDMSTYTRVAELFDEDLPKSNIKSVSFNRRGNLLVAFFEGGELVIWDTLKSEIIFTYEYNPLDRIIFAKFMSIQDSVVIVKESGIVEMIYNEDKIFLSQVYTKGAIFCADMSIEKIFLLDNIGILFVVNLRDGAELGSFTEIDMGITEASGITSLSCHPERDLLSVVCKNRTIRIVEFDSGSKNFLLKFKLIDAVNKWPWRLSGFSQHENVDSMLIFGSAMAKGQHLIYLWDNVTGSLVQALEGPKEEVSVALWHPRKPQMITVGALSGQIFVWGPDFPQKWAALVPNIEAIETNIEYIEREDEFDLPIEEEIKANIHLDESVEIDFKDFITCSMDADRDDDRSLYYPIDLRLFLK